MQFLFIALASLVMAASGQIVMDGQCQNETLVENFDLVKYSGLWYETYRYDQDFEFFGECVTAEYTLENDTVKVFNSMVIKGSKFSIAGTAVFAPDANGRGKLLVNFPSTGNTYGNYWVLSTDYVNYSLVFGCNNLSDKTKRVSSWVLSRKPILSPQSVLAMNDALQKVDGLLWDNYRYTNQTESACKITGV